MSSTELAAPPAQMVSWFCQAKTNPHMFFRVQAKLWFEARELGLREFRLHGVSLERHEIEVLLEDSGL